MSLATDQSIENPNDNPQPIEEEKKETFVEMVITKTK
jgi:hypothetical protein